MRATAAVLSLVVCAVASSAAAEGPFAPNAMGVQTPRCDAEVRRNLLTDEVHETVVPLEAPDYRLRVADRRVVVTPVARGWALRARLPLTTITVTYEIRDARSGLLVLRAHTEIPCLAGDDDPLGEIAPPPSPSPDDDLDAVPAPPRPAPTATDRVQVFGNFGVDLATDWGWLSTGLLGQAVLGHIGTPSGARGVLTSPSAMPEVGVRVPVMRGAYVSALLRPMMNIDSYVFAEGSVGLGVRSRGAFRVFAEIDGVARVFYHPGALLLDAEAIAGFEVEPGAGVSVGVYVHKSLIDAESIGSVAYVAVTV